MSNIHLPSGLLDFLEEADDICVKTNQWLMDQIEALGCEIEFKEFFRSGERWVASYAGKAVLICEYSWEISYRNRFTMAHELGHLLFTARHPKIAHDLDVIKKHIKEGFSVSPEEEKRLEEMEEKCNEFAGRLLISKKYAGEVWDLWKEVCEWREYDWLPFFASYFCVSEPCWSIAARRYWLPGYSPPIEICI